MMGLLLLVGWLADCFGGGGVRDDRNDATIGATTYKLSQSVQLEKKRHRQEDPSNMNARSPQHSTVPHLLALPLPCRRPEEEPE